MTGANPRAPRELVLVVRDESAGGNQLEWLLHAVRRSWRVGAAIVCAFLCTGIAVALIMKPVYRGEVTVIPQSSERGGGLLRGLSGSAMGAAALQGLGFGAMESSKAEALAVLRSRAFIEDFITREDLLPQLFPDRWEPGAEQWAIDEDTGRRDAPSMHLAYLKVLSACLRISENIEAGTISISIDWKDRERAPVLANRLVASLNEVMRSRAREDAEKNIAFLKLQLANSTVFETRASVARLLESQLQQLMLANGRGEFALKVLSPAMTSDPTERVAPRRRLIVVAFTIAGAILALMLVLWQALLAERNGGRAPVPRAP